MLSIKDTHQLSAMRPYKGILGQKRPCLVQCRQQQILVRASIPNILTDVVILILPVPFVFSLKMRRAKKFGVCGLFLLEEL